MGSNEAASSGAGGAGAGATGAGSGGKAAGSTGATGAVASGSGGDIVIGSGTMRTDPNSGPDGSCAATSATAEQQVITKEIVTQSPVALYLVQDRSGSMRDTPNGNSMSKWTQTIDGVNAFVADPMSANLDVALGFFPISGGGCDGTNYSTPAVPMARLPSAPQVQAVAAAITSNAPGGGGGGLGNPGASGTPIEGALRGGENFCMIYQAQNPQEKCVVVLLTDGAPNGCSGDFTVISGIAADAKTRANVMTFAVGMDGADFNLLDQIATAGGSNCGATPSCNVNGNGTSLIDALNKIRTTVTQTMTVVQSTKLACEYAIPPPKDGEKLDRNKVNVQITKDGAVQKLGQVPDLGSCPQFGGKGWYYDDPTNPKSVKFCPGTCGSLETPDGGVPPGTTAPKVDVLFGCQTITAIPA